MSRAHVGEAVEAELVEDAADSRREQLQLNLALGATAIVVVLFMLLASIWGVQSTGDGDGFGDWEWWEVPLEQRHAMGLNVTGWRSQLPEPGPYDWSGPTEYFVEVDLPASEQDAGYPEPALMHVSIWMPDVPEGTKVPVIATVHPYYDFGGEGVPGAGDDSNPNTVPDFGVGAWVLEQFVPYGFALAQISTFGTGKSTHCQDVKGLGEQIGIQAAVHWLGEQDWSNGNVGLMGKSYAGTTNWEAAQNPSEHLKTIVPISGSIGVQQMFYRNGSSESRAMLYDVLYEGATTDPTEDDMRMCSDDIIGPISPFTTWLGAGMGGDQWNEGDVSCSVVRRVALPDAFLAIDGLFQTFLTVLDEFGAYPAVVERELRQYLPFLATTRVLVAAVVAGMGREAAHAVIGEHAVAAALARREEGVAVTDLIDRLAADPRLPWDRSALDDLLADPSVFAGNAAKQIDAVILRIAEVVAARPTAAAYDPEPIL